MALNPYNDNLMIIAPKALDNRWGRFSGGAWRPFNDMSEFMTYQVFGIRYETQLVFVRSTTNALRSDIFILDKNKDPYLLIPDVDLSNYYNKGQIDVFNETLSEAIANAQSDATGALQAITSINQTITTLQPKTDNALNTTSKTVVGGINEVKAKADSADAKAVVAQEDIEDIETVQLPAKQSISEKDQSSGYVGLTSDVISDINPYTKSSNFFKIDNAITVEQMAVYPEWYKQKRGLKYKNTEYWVSPNIFGAFGDGVYHPLSERFSTLSDAQVAYPFATSLTDSIDWAATQKAINFLSSLSRGDLHINDNDGYNFNYNKVIISTSNLHTSGKGLIKNGCFAYYGASAGAEFNFTFDGPRIEYDTLTVGENLETNNGIEFKNVSRGFVSDAFFLNTNANIYVIPTGVFQQTKRITITNCISQYMNYAIKVAETPALIGGVPPVSTRSVGDIKIFNSSFQWPYYDHMFLAGVDGLLLSGVDCFFSPTANQNRATKRNNLRAFRLTYTNISDCNFFEAGEDGLYFCDCDNIQVSNSQIAWPGQRLASCGIHITRTKAPTDVEVSMGFSNILIDTPTLHGTLIDGEFATQMYDFKGIRVNKLGRSDRYYGAGAPYNNPTLGNYPHQTIYSNSFATGITYDGTFDSEWITRGAKFDGTGCYALELNTRRGARKETISTDSAYDDTEVSNYVGILENLLPGSNNLSTTSQFTVLNSTISQLTNYPGPFGIGTSWRLTEDSVVNTQKSISTATTLTKPSATDLPYTVSIYCKAAERQFLCLYVTNASFNNGIKIDYDILNGSTGSIQRTDTDYKIIRTKIRQCNNGFFRITLSYLSPAKHTTVRAAIYMKDKIQDVGNQSYIGDGVSSLILSDFQVSQTSIPLPYILTTSGAVSQRPNTSLPLTLTDVQNTQFKGAFRVLTSATTLALADFGKNGLLTIYADASGGAFQIVLVGSALDSGYTTKIVKTDSSANTVSVKGLGAELINSVNIDTTLNTQYSSFILESNGTKHLKF